MERSGIKILKSPADSSYSISGMAENMCIAEMCRYAPRRIKTEGIEWETR
jgi:hypothetical protein